MLKVFDKEKPWENYKSNYLWASVNRCISNISTYQTYQ